MRAQISQEILIEVAGSFSRREVVRAITRMRHELERKVSDGSVIPSAEMMPLVRFCEELQLTAFEVVEALGSTWTTDRAHMELTMEDLPIVEWNVWFEEHRDADLGQFELLGEQDDRAT